VKCPRTDEPKIDKRVACARPEGEADALDMAPPVLPTVLAKWSLGADMAERQSLRDRRRRDGAPFVSGAGIEIGPRGLLTTGMRSAYAAEDMSTSATNPPVADSLTPTAVNGGTWCAAFYYWFTNPPASLAGQFG